MKLSRRNILQMAGSVPFSLDAVRVAAQGMATRGVKPSPRSKSSGIPFLVRFTDVAEAAGLHAPTVYGGISRKNYIVETMGCGCALFDYDNDGWLDIFILCGTRFLRRRARARTRMRGSGGATRIKVRGYRGSPARRSSPTAARKRRHRPERSPTRRATARSTCSPADTVGVRYTTDAWPGRYCERPRRD